MHNITEDLNGPLFFACKNIKITVQKLDVMFVEFM